jgi:hypothetical protein
MTILAHRIVCVAIAYVAAAFERGPQVAVISAEITLTEVCPNVIDRREPRCGRAEFVL